MSEPKLIYQKLSKIDVSKHTEKRNGLSYLSWAHAWNELLKKYPEATYTIHTFTNSVTGETKPYLQDEALGYIVFTSIQIEGLERTMWLPVMDGANNPLKTESWTYKVKEYKAGRWTGEFIEKQVQPINMFDVNKAIMRCLTKNIGMFGLGLNIYAGEEFQEPEPPPPPPPIKPKLTTEMFEKAKGFNAAQIEKVLNQFQMSATRQKALTEILIKLREDGSQ